MKEVVKSQLPNNSKSKRRKKKNLNQAKMKWRKSKFPSNNSPTSPLNQNNKKISPLPKEQQVPTK